MTESNFFNPEPFNELVCDFCCIPEIAEDFEAPGITAAAIAPDGTIMGGINYEPKWAACRECARLIHAHNMDALIERVISTQEMLTPGLPREAYERDLRIMYTVIFTAMDIREGQAI